jgi:hypothetical protein
MEGNAHRRRRRQAASSAHADHSRGPSVSDTGLVIRCKLPSRGDAEALAAWLSEQPVELEARDAGGWWVEVDTGLAGTPDFSELLMDMRLLGLEPVILRPDADRPRRPTARPDLA